MYLMLALVAVALQLVQSAGADETDGCLLALRAACPNSPADHGTDGSGCDACRVGASLAAGCSQAVVRSYCTRERPSTSGADPADFSSAGIFVDCSRGRDTAAGSRPSAAFATVNRALAVLQARGRNMAALPLYAVICCHSSGLPI
jgi:hypothetical protein